MKKSVGILSMQKVDNFGSLLQSYSLKKELEKLNSNVQFIDIEKNIDDDIMFDKKEEFREEKQIKESKFSKIDKYALNRLKIKYLNKMQEKIFEEFRINELNIYNKNIKKYDVCIIGSDEVFNCSASKPWGFTSQLFGNVKNAEKVITYAASCGSTTFNKLNERVKEKILDSFKNISSFSVRDSNTYDFVKKIGDFDVNINFDPVLIGDFNKEIEENKIILPKRFCIVYSYYNRFETKEEINEIKKFCKKNKLKIITIGAPQFWIPKHYVMSPFQVLYAFSKADFVITDTFHGTIFASKYSKKFSIIVRDSNKFKLGDLIDRLHIEQHLCNNISDINEVYHISNDINRIKKICSDECKKTRKYLEENL